LLGTPPSDNRPHGVFATRSPRRPNPIGVTTVELRRREGIELHVHGIDMLDKTPILDIKPYHYPRKGTPWVAGRSRGTKGAMIANSLSIPRLGYLRRFQFLNPHARDAVALHLFDRVTMAVVIEAFAHARNFLQAGEHESSQCFKS
jgi:tRNA-methyltransferase O